MFKQTTTYLLENKVLCKMSVCVHAHDHEAHVNLQWPCNNVHFSQRRSISFPEDLAGPLLLVLRGRLWLVQPKWLWLAQTSLPGLIKQAVSGSFSELIVRYFPGQPLWCCSGSIHLLCDAFPYHCRIWFSVTEVSLHSMGLFLIGSPSCF